MNPHPIRLLIERADAAINCEDFDTVLDIYAEDAVLVVRPGMNACGKDQIRKAFEAISAYFNHSLHVRQAAMEILEAADSALVLARAVISAPNIGSITRNATYVFRKNSNGNWLCVIDNSYGHEVLARADDSGK